MGLSNHHKCIRLTRHWPFAPELIPCQAKDGCTDRAQEESQSNSGSDVGVGGVVVAGELGSLDAQGVEVKGVLKYSGQQL